MHTLPHLPYNYDALEPVIDTQTMQIHHTRHHQWYIDKLNIGLSVYPQYEWLSVIELLQQFDTLPEELKPIVRNHGGGHANHSLFWKILCPLEQSTSSTTTANQMREAIDQTFSSFDHFVEKMLSAWVWHFGSGWVWLVYNPTLQTLEVMTTSNQDSPYIFWLVPVLGIDLREHAYYLHYQNKRADYIQACMSIINWEQVQKNYNVVR